MPCHAIYCNPVVNFFSPSLDPSVRPFVRLSCSLPICFAPFYTICVVARCFTCIQFINPLCTPCECAINSLHICNFGFALNVVFSSIASRLLWFGLFLSHFNVKLEQRCSFGFAFFFFFISCVDFYLIFCFSLFISVFFFLSCYIHHHHYHFQSQCLTMDGRFSVT